MKSIKSKIWVGMLSVVLIGSTLIGVFTALLNARGIDALLKKTLGPATQMAANAVRWRMDNYWTALQEAAASDIFRNSEPTAPELVPVRDDIAARNGFLYTGKIDADGFSSTGQSYADKDYFQQCKAAMKPYISDIMNDGNQMIFLLEVPILTDGRFDGVVYGGISADFLTDIVVNLAMGDSGVAYVMDHRGNVIGHRESSVVEKGSNMIEAAKEDPSVSDIAAVNQRMIQGETGFGTYKFYDDEKLVGFAPIGGNQNWSIAIEASQREFKSTLHQSFILTILVVLIVVIVSFFVAYPLARSISNPIRACGTRLEQLADGDLRTPTPAVSSRDETGELTNALGTTISRLDEVVQDVSHHLVQMARGDFRETIVRTYRGDFSEIEKSIKTIHGSLKDTLFQISQSAGTVAASAGQMAAVQELSDTVADISENARQTAAAAAEAGQFVNQVVAQLVASVDSVGELNRAMEKISVSSAQISKIINTIEDIAVQTNILALNAAVEATRAGAAGRSFSVVAGEVRSLASKSDVAAKATKELIERSISAVSEGNLAVGKVTSSLAETSTLAENVTAKMDTVVTAVDNQTATISQVTEGINQISAVVKVTSATSKESASNSQRLSEQSRLMNDLAGKFRLQ